MCSFNRCIRLSGKLNLHPNNIRNVKNSEFMLLYIQNRFFGVPLLYSLYKAHLLDHYRYPRNTAPLPYANCIFTHDNPACGDSVSMAAYIDGGIIRDTSFTARGCVISVAAASLLSDQIKGQPLTALDALDAQTMITLLGITIGPTRLKCALLPLYALQDGIKQYTNGMSLE